ncbi:MAG: hypothetical protein FWD23_06785 [Oscillospiraceae bacterium]|nr:hypothetical protein [Oscillospiraceae bacterium]
MDGRKETVLKAVAGQGPERIPLLYAYSLEKSDIINIPVVRHFTGPEKNMSEWGFKWANLNDGLLMGQPECPVIKDWGELSKFKMPDARDSGRFAHVPEIMDRYGSDRYYKANFTLSGFAVISMLRGFSNICEDFYLEGENLLALTDMVFEFEREIIRQAAKYGFCAIGLADDWGSQSSLFISPALWREIFKPRYKESIELAHSLGLQVYLHSCGYIFDIIEDLTEIGLDIINPGQPDINGIEAMGNQFGGRICFACPPSYQSTAISGKETGIREQIRLYRKHLHKSGGLIGIIPEDSAALGITPENFRAMEEAFQLPL